MSRSGPPDGLDALSPPDRARLLRLVADAKKRRRKADNGSERSVKQKSSSSGDAQPPAAPPPMSRGHWSEAEHAKFVAALAVHGRDWVKVAYAVGSRTLAQVRSHAQKHFLKQKDLANAPRGSGDPARAAIIARAVAARAAPAPAPPPPTAGDSAAMLSALAAVCSHLAPPAPVPIRGPQPPPQGEGDGGWADDAPAPWRARAPPSAGWVFLRARARPGRLARSSAGFASYYKLVRTKSGRAPSPHPFASTNCNRAALNAHFGLINRSWWSIQCVGAAGRPRDTGQQPSPERGQLRGAKACRPTPRRATTSADPWRSTDRRDRATRVLAPSDAAAGDGFGVSVASTGTPSWLPGTGRWLHLQHNRRLDHAHGDKLTVADAALGLLRGAIAGDTAVVGAYGKDDDMGANLSHERRRRHQVAKLTASDGAEDDEFGYLAAIDGRGCGPEGRRLPHERRRRHVR